MDASTVRFHETVLRQLKGVLSAYEQWLDEERISAMAEHLRAEKEELRQPSEPEQPLLEFPLRKK